jgi:hypothetical protein
MHILTGVFLSSSGLKRCGKSCRLRWLNYLRPDIKRGNISPDEEELIIRLHKLLGNRFLSLSKEKNVTDILRHAADDVEFGLFLDGL